LGIVEIIVILAENLPDVMRAAGKILRELRLASNMVVRELSGALDQPSEDQPAPPINTMKPGAIATGANIAQSAAPADSATPSAMRSSASSDATEATAVAPTPAPIESAATPAAPAGPKATV
jgi:Sec-independent protein translocase protein TatA